MSLYIHFLQPRLRARQMELKTSCELATADASPDTALRNELRLTENAHFHSQIDRTTTTRPLQPSLRTRQSSSTLHPHQSGWTQECLFITSAHESMDTRQMERRRHGLDCVRISIMSIASRPAYIPAIAYTITARLLGRLRPCRLH